MSLLVWLPLNGNLKNRGLVNLSYSDVDPVYINEGKIGKALYIDGTASENINLQIGELEGLKKFSISFWKNTLYTSSHIEHSSTLRVGLHVKTKESLGGYETDSQFWLQRGEKTSENVISNLYWMYYYNNGGVKSPNYCGCSFSEAGWMHCTVTCDGEYFRYYKNGNLLDTTYKISDHLDDYYLMGTLILCCHDNSQNYLNDVRIYDHCLSNTEVHEISKGLVLHYPLNQNIRNKNLISGNYWCKSTNDTFSQSDNSISSIPGSVIEANKGRTLYLSADICTLGDIQPGEEGWQENRFGTHGNIQLDGVDNYPLAGLLDLGKSPGRYTCSWTIPTNFTTATTDLRFGGQFDPSEGYCRPASNNPTTWYWKNIKLEWDCPTSYTPFNAENSLKEYDCSGYGNHGEINTEMRLSSMSPRYRYSTYFNGTDNCIVIPYNSVCPNNEFTMNVWFYKEHIGSKQYETLFGGPSGFELDTRYNDNTYLTLYREGGYYICQMDFGRWNMVTFTRDKDRNEQYYLNGNLVGERVAPEERIMPSGEYYIGSWAAKIGGQNYEGLVSDFRLYTTILTAADIKELYNTAAKIGDTGTLMCYEIKEN